MCGSIKVLLFEPENPEDLASKIIQVLSDDRLRNELSTYNHEFVANYDYETIASRFVKVLVQKRRG